MILPSLIELCRADDQVVLEAALTAIDTCMPYFDRGTVTGDL
jgi:hypothetical protein